MVLMAALAAAVSALVVAQKVGSAGNNWAFPQGDPGGTRFSTLTQINTANVTTLERAWTFHTGSGRFSVSPMVVDSVMYFSAPNGVFAVDAVTGEQIWKYVPPTPSAEALAASGRGGGGGGGGGRGGGRGGGGAAGGDPQA